MKSEDDLWDTGKEDDTSSSNSDDDSSTLDLSETSPEKDEKEIENLTFQISSRAEYLSVRPEVQHRLSNIDKISIFIPII